MPFFRAASNPPPSLASESLPRTIATRPSGHLGPDVSSPDKDSGADEARGFTAGDAGAGFGSGSVGWSDAGEGGGGGDVSMAEGPCTASTGPPVPSPRP